MKGVSFCGLLGIAFIVWSWWWVTAPLWIPFAIGCVLLPFYLLAKKKEVDEKYNKPTKSKWQQRVEQIQQAQKNKQA